MVVYENVDNDSTWDPDNERRLSDACIVVLDSNGIVLGEHITNGTEPCCFAGLDPGDYNVLNKNPLEYIVYNPYDPYSRVDMETRRVRVFANDIITVEFGSQQGVPEQPTLRFRCAWQDQGCEKFCIHGKLCNVTRNRLEYIGVSASEDYEFVEDVPVHPNSFRIIPGLSCRDIAVRVIMNQYWDDQPDGTVVRIQLYANALLKPGGSTEVGTEPLIIIKQCSGSSIPSPVRQCLPITSSITTARNAFAMDNGHREHWERK